MLPKLICSVEITEACNQLCSYCYKYNQSYDGHDPHGKLSHSSSQTLQLFANWVSDYKGSICFQFHGGEPLSRFLDIKRFVEFVQNDEELRRRPIEFAVQTNATLATPEIVDWLASNEVGVGISFGGTSESHNLHRPMKNGGPSYDRANYGIKCILTKLPRSTCNLVIVDPNCLVEDVEHAVDVGFTSIAIVPVNDPIVQTQEWQTQFAEAHLRAVKILGHRNVEAANQIYEQSAIAVLRALHSNQSGYMCQSWPCGAGTELLALSAKGDLYPCDTLFGMREWCYGNVRKLAASGVSVSDILVSHVSAPLRERTSEAVPGCQTCVAKGSCGGGCPAITYRRLGSIYHPSSHCTYSAKFHAGIDALTLKSPKFAALIARPALLR